MYYATWRPGPRRDGLSLEGVKFLINLAMRSLMKGNRALGLSIMFFVLAIALALILWPDTSWAAKIAFFLFGLPRVFWPDSTSPGGVPADGGRSGHERC